MKTEQLNELLYQALETEQGGSRCTRRRCAELKEEWREYLEQTRRHEQSVLRVFEAFELDPEADTPGRRVVRHIGESLVRAMEMALEAGNREAGPAHGRRVRGGGGDEGPPELGAASPGRRGGEGRQGQGAHAGGGRGGPSRPARECCKRYLQ